MKKLLALILAAICCLGMFACGGEGTVFEVLNGTVGYSNVELGVIPCGSANDFLKFFESRDNFLDIAEQIDGETVEMDLIKAGKNYCLNGCSVGMDAIVARDMSIFKNWPLVSGSFAYTLAIVKTFLGKLGITAESLLSQALSSNLKRALSNMRTVSLRYIKKMTRSLLRLRMKEKKALRFWDFPQTAVL